MSLKYLKRATKSRTLSLSDVTKTVKSMLTKIQSEGEEKALYYAKKF